MIRRSFTTAAIAASLLAVLGSAAVAAPTDWSNPSGSTSTFAYSNGQNANGAFGSPSVSSGGFFFRPDGLVANATGNFEFARVTPGSNSASDTLSVILNANADSQFTRIGANVLGDYSVFGFGTVDSTATLRVTNLDTSTTLTSPLSFGGAFPVFTTESAGGDFEGLTSLALPAGWRNIRVELDDTVSADALFGSSFIQTKGAQIDVETAAIPIPAAVAIAPILGVVAYKLRRKIVR